MFPNLPTPSLLVDRIRLEANLVTMQNRCNSAQIELRPHIKTHKCVEIAHRQLQLGAAGLTCAKVGEAEAMLPAFEGIERREIFIAHSLVDEALAPRLNQLREQLDELVLAVTSVHHAPVLNALVAKVGGSLPVMMAIDSGLGREGARGLEGALELARLVESLPHLELRGIYTHEGHFYTGVSEEAIAQWHAKIVEVHEAVQAEIGRRLVLWPGSSASAHLVAGLPGLDAIRPGSYVFGDLAMTKTIAVISPDSVALQVLATVVDRPEKGLALIDSGSKTFSGDRTPNGIFAACEWGEVNRVSEEHGFLVGERVEELRVGQRILLTPAHVCPVVNLADNLQVVEGETFSESWRVAARGKVN
jgi:D-serine deaminase-like pyridoxal phosphate-dependent protein